MFDFGWGELLIIGIVALIVVGDDFPTMFRTMGRFTGKIRRMAREFQRAMEDAANEAGVKDATDALKGATNPAKMGLNKLNEAADRFEKWDPTKPASKPKPKPKGPETQKLSEERAASAKKYAEVTAKRAEAKKAAEKAAAEAAAAKPADAPETPEAKDA
jgi:sec-independent protein translocase protein TatB